MRESGFNLICSFTYVRASDFGSAFSGVLTDERGRVQAIWGSFSTQVSTVNLLVTCFMMVPILMLTFPVSAKIWLQFI